MNTSTDNIELLLPFKAEYVSVARLAVSGIANRIGFDIEAIEDIKVAVAEVCNKLVTAGSKCAAAYRIIFKISEESLTVVFDCEDKLLQCVFDSENDEFVISIIDALMDNVEYCNENNYILLMSKGLERNR